MAVTIAKIERFKAQGSSGLMVAERLDFGMPYGVLAANSLRHRGQKTSPHFVPLGYRALAIDRPLSVNPSKRAKSAGLA
jgi:hypothetical protein